MSIEERRLRGEQFQETMRPGMSAHLKKRFTGASADFGAYSTELLFGEMWQRDGLDVRSREIAVLGALLGGGYLADFRVHIPIAVNLGLSRDEIFEVIYQLALYVGWPRAAEGLAIVEEVLPEPK